MRYVWLTRLWAIVCTVPFPVSFHSSAELRLGLLHGTFSPYWPLSEWAALSIPLPVYQFLQQEGFFPFSSSELKRMKEKKREASLRDTGDIAESSSGKGLSAKMMDVTGEPESNRVWQTAKEVRSYSKSHACLAWEGVFYLCFFVVFSSWFMVALLPFYAIRGQEQALLCCNSLQ